MDMIAIEDMIKLENFNKIEKIEKNHEFEYLMVERYDVGTLEEIEDVIKCNIDGTNYVAVSHKDYELIMSYADDDSYGEDGEFNLHFLMSDEPEDGSSGCNLAEAPEFADENYVFFKYPEEYPRLLSF